MLGRKQEKLRKILNYGHAKNIILALLSDLLCQGYCVYSNNFTVAYNNTVADNNSSILKDKNTDKVRRQNRKGISLKIL